MKAEILFYGDNPHNPDLQATVSLVDGMAVVHTDHEELRTMLEVVRGRGGVEYKPADGIGFIHELPFVFSGGYIRARVVDDD